MVIADSGTGQTCSTDGESLSWNMTQMIDIINAGMQSHLIFLSPEHLYILCVLSVLSRIL